MTSFVVITCGSSPVWRGGGKPFEIAQYFWAKCNCPLNPETEKRVFVYLVFVCFVFKLKSGLSVGEPRESLGSLTCPFLVADLRYESPGLSHTLLASCKTRPRESMHGGHMRETVGSTLKAIRTLLFFLKRIVIFFNPSRKQHS